MEKQTQFTHHPKFNPLPSGDTGSAFHYFTPAEILARYGPPTSLLSSSAKTEKCLAVDVLLRVLYLTPGIFCPAATDGCRRACLGHSSGRMQMPTHAAARDRRSAQYLENPSLFLARLTLELAEHVQDATRRNLRPAVRLNASSDLPWETLHPELFQQFSRIQFFDYTKVPSRMEDYVSARAQGRPWPENYHLTFSATPENHDLALRFLKLGHSVTAVFWPDIPSSLWGFPVIDGDSHDARFLDPAGVIVGLRAKGLAQVDLTGFTIRTCPKCQAPSTGLRLVYAIQKKRRTILHRCPRCGFQHYSRRLIPPDIHPCRTTSTLQ